MALKYAVIEIWTSERAQWKGQALDQAIPEALKAEKIPARCMVLRGTSGVFETGEMASQNILLLSMNMPIKVEVVLPQGELERTLALIDRLVEDGIVSVGDLDVRFHRTPHRLIPAGLLARDVMTTQPQTVSPETPVADVVRLLVGAQFHGVPVVDADQKVVGMITQSDLIARGGMPVRLGLLARFDQSALDAHFQDLSQKVASQVMTSPVVTVREDQAPDEVVSLMLRKGLKRLPVVDASGHLCGMLSRVDIFRTVQDAGVVYQTLEKHQVDLTQVRFVRDIVEREMHVVRPDASVDEVLHQIGAGDMQRIAVVDHDGRFLGLIFDHDLLEKLVGQTPGIWNQIAGFFTRDRAGSRGALGADSLGNAEGLMQTEIATVREDTPIDEAIRVMVEHQFKRLPVVDADGVFKGMISRDAVLQAGWDG